MTVDPRELARWARLVTANRLICLGPDYRNTGRGGTTHGGADFCTPVEDLANALLEVAMLVDPREVARWVFTGGMAYQQGNPGSGFCSSGGGAWPDKPRDPRMFSRRLDAIHEEGAMQADLIQSKPPPRRCAVPLLVELCAGTAALSLRLEREKARPPVSRMGAKTGYADAVLALAGLRAGDGAAHYLWCEPDDGVRLLLHAYRDAELATQAAEIIRGWAYHDPRDLWEALREEGPARCPPVDAREVARSLALWGMCYRQGDPSSGGPVLPGERYSDSTPEGVADRLTGGLPATIHDDATTLDPREVARSSWLWARSVAFKGPAAGYMPSGEEDGSGRWVNTPNGIARKWAETGGLPATIHDDATTAPIPDPLPAGTLVYIDPPYVGTTPYAHDDLGRPQVVQLAQRWAAAGARVMISEAEPIEALVAAGWHAVEITAMRVGQRRTFSKQQREWVTCSFPPDPRAVRVFEYAHDQERRRAEARTGDQVGLFGGGDK